MSKDHYIISGAPDKGARAPVKSPTRVPKPGPRSAPRPSAEAKRWGDAWIESICQPHAFRNTNLQAIYLIVAADVVLEAGASSASLEEEIARVLSDPAEARRVIGEATPDRQITCLEDHLMEGFSPAKEEITEPVVEWLRQGGPHSMGGVV